MLSSIKTKITLWCTIILWASAFPAIRAGLEGYGPGSLALLRFLVASVCMALLYPYLPKRKSIPFSEKLRFLTVGAIGIGIYHVALNYGELTVPSGIASFIISQSPVFSVIFAMIFLKEEFGLKAFIGMFISLLGIALITLSHQANMSFDKGVLYVMIAAIAGSLFSILQKPALRKYHAMEVTAYAIWGGTLLLSVFSPTLMTDIKTAPLGATLSVLYLGIFPAAVAYISWSYTLQAMPVARASVYLYFMPIVATLLGWLWLHEVPSLSSFIGGLVALSGVWLINHAFRPR